MDTGFIGQHTLAWMIETLSDAIAALPEDKQTQLRAMRHELLRQGARPIEVMPSAPVVRLNKVA